MRNYDAGQKHGVTCKVRVRGDVRHYISKLLYWGPMTEEGVVISTVVGSRVPAI